MSQRTKGIAFISENVLNKQAASYMRDIRVPWKLKAYLFKNLPSALWWGFRIQQLSPGASQVEIPYCWRTKNPFSSIYFAALCGAGEFATGILANLARIGKGNISMLVLEQRAEFLKKAATNIVFSCNEGEQVQATVDLAIQSGIPQAITMMAEGTNRSGEPVARVYITWTFKYKSNPSLQ